MRIFVRSYKERFIQRLNRLFLKTVEKEFILHITIY